MPSNVVNQRHFSPFGLHSDASSFFSEELLFPTEQVGFQKPESLPDQHGTEGLPLRSGSKSVCSSPLNKLHLQRGYSNSLEGFGLPQPSIYKDQKTKLSIENRLMDLENVTQLSVNIVKDADGEAIPQSVLLSHPASLFAEGNKKNTRSSCYQNGLFSSSLSEIFSKKLILSSNNPLGQSVNTVDSSFEGDDPFESMAELEAHTIGNLLPDDDDLLSGVTDDFGYVNRPNNTDDIDDDIFYTGGGMELEADQSRNNKFSELLSGGAPNSHQGGLNGSFAGEHPFGEHPSRTLFVRNINSSVEDSELSTLFEQYGDVRTLYTACKHRGFVMISYYDIRSARNAMKALQNKPLRRWKLDIHYSIPKDNPSDKDINHGTLVVFTLDSVSNDDLRQIFGVYGEIKEIRETPHKNHQKFIEFYDVRAADAALRALNRNNISGMKIKLESSQPSGARRCLMQQLSPELEQEELNACMQGSPHNALSGCYGSVSVGAITPGSLDNGATRSLSASSRTPTGAFLDTMYHGISSGVTQGLSSPVRITSAGNHNNETGHSDFGHSMSQINFGYQNMRSFHPHSLPEYHKGVNNGISFASNALSPGGICINSRSAEGIDNRNIHGIGSGSLISHSFDHNEAFGVSGNGSCPLHGHHYVWNNSNSFHPNPADAVIWSNSPSFLNNVPTHRQPQMHGIPRMPSHLLNTVLPLHHHAGSAPNVNPSLWDRRHPYPRESTEPAAFHPGSLGSMNFSDSIQLHPLELASCNSFPHVGGNCIDPSLSPAHIGISSPQQRMFHGRNPMMSMSGSFDSPTDRIRSRRNDSNANQAENKKQYELDIDRIVRGEDSRTTLMIKNIPNKYTSKMLLAAIDENHRGTYDFIYLPIDFKNKCNVGYAFINMIEPQHIIPLYQSFNGKKWEKFNSEKVASLAYARIQGKAALIAHFQNSSLMNEDKRCRPILFRSDGPNAGDQEPFPMGTNIRSRSGRSRASNGSEENSQGSPSNPANGDNSGDAASSPTDSVKDVE